MDSPADIIAQYLIGEGELTAVGDSGDWKVYVGLLPDGDVDDVDHDIVGCMDTESVKDGRIMNEGENIFHYGVQLLLRATDYDVGYAKMSELEEVLEAVKRATVAIGSSNYRLDNITLTTGVVVVGQEEGSKRRELFSLNFLVTLKEL